MLKVKVIYKSINHLFVLNSTRKKSVYTIQCRTGHKGVKHLQVPQTMPNNKNTKNHIYIHSTSTKLKEKTPSVTVSKQHSG